MSSNSGEEMSKNTDYDIMMVQRSEMMAQKNILDETKQDSISISNVLNIISIFEYLLSV